VFLLGTTWHNKKFSPPIVRVLIQAGERQLLGASKKKKKMLNRAPYGDQQGLGDKSGGRARLVTHDDVTDYNVL
jgi:hypothetical protein